MAATVHINEFNGAGRTKTQKTSGTIRFRNSDAATVDLNNPLVVPSSLREYSYEKWLRLEVTAGTYTQISNLRAYSDGGNGFGTGVKLWYGTAASYLTPSIPDENNDPPEFSAGGSPQVAMSDFFGATSGSPIDLDALNTGPFGSGSPQFQEIGDYLVLVMEVETTASNGLLTAEGLTVGYDEI